MALMEMFVLDMSGDTRIYWDSTNPAEVEHARRSFNEMKQAGFTAHLVAGKRGRKTGGTMAEFDPEAEGLVMVPPMTAG